MDSKFESAKYIDVRVKSEHTIDVKKPGFFGTFLKFLEIEPLKKLCFAPLPQIAYSPDIRRSRWSWIKLCIFDCKA